MHEKAVLFPNFYSHRLTSYTSKKHNRNIFYLLKCTSLNFFTTKFEYTNYGKKISGSASFIQKFLI